MKVPQLGSNDEKNSEKDFNKIEARFAEGWSTKYVQCLVIYLVGHG